MFILDAELRCERCSLKTRNTWKLIVNSDKNMNIKQVKNAVLRLETLTYIVNGNKNTDIKQKTK